MAQKVGKKEEEEVMKFLINCAAVGFLSSRMQVISMVQEVCNKRNIDAVVSYGWWERAIEMYTSEVVLCCLKLEPEGTNLEAIDEYFDILV